MSQTLGTGISQLQALSDQIRRQWYGPASDTFRGELDRLVLQMQETGSKLMAAADSLESAGTTPM